VAEKKRLYAVVEVTEDVSVPGVSIIGNGKVQSVDTMLIRDAVERYGRAWVVRELEHLTERVRLGGSA
jgi:tRNA-dihydrouridine synthase